jgi:hypothetical protein
LRLPAIAGTGNIAKYKRIIMTIVTDYRDKVICEGTLRNSNLIRAFGRALADLAPDAHEAIFEDADYMLIRQMLLQGDEYLVDYGRMSAIAENLAADLDVELGAHAPDGYYFGTQEGDGACFGFWRLDDDND